MADAAISALTEHTLPIRTDVIPIVNAGATKKITYSNLLIPRFDYILDFGGSDTPQYTASSGNITLAAGGGSIGTLNDYGRLLMTAATNNTSNPYMINTRAGYTGTEAFSHWDYNPTLIMLANPSPVLESGGYATMYMGTYVNPNLSAFTAKHIGFRFLGNGTTATAYATSANGTTETATDITASMPSGWAGVSNYNRYVIEVNSGVNIKFWVGGTLVATHTTNLPATTSTSDNLCTFAIKCGGSNNKAHMMFVANLKFSYNAR